MDHFQFTPPGRRCWGLPRANRIGEWVVSEHIIITILIIIITIIIIISITISIIIITIIICIITGSGEGN